MLGIKWHRGCVRPYVSDSANPKRKRTFAWLAAVALAAAGASHAQPELKTIHPKGPVHQDEPFTVVCEVSWAGSPGQWAVLPAQVEPFDWGSAEVTQIKASVRDGINVLTQNVVIKPVKAGAHKSPEILIAYRNPEDLTPPETSAPATDPMGTRVDPTLRTTPFILHVKPDRTLAWVFGGLGALLLCLVLGWWSARKRRPPAGHLPFSPTLSAESALLEDARRHRLDGHPYEFYLSLMRTLSACPNEGDLSSRLKECAQAVGYQGVVPTEAQMNDHYAEVERALARRLRREARSA